MASSGVGYRGNIRKKLVTPLTENEYVVKHVLPTDLAEYRMMRNLLLISSLGSDSKMNQILRKALNDEVYDKIVSKEQYMFVARDQWTSDQFMVILAAPGIEELKESRFNRNDAP